MFPCCSLHLSHPLLSPNKFIFEIYCSNCSSESKLFPLWPLPQAQSQAWPVAGDVWWEPRQGVISRCLLFFSLLSHPPPPSTSFGSHRVWMGCMGIREGVKSLRAWTVTVTDAFVDSIMQGLVPWDTVGTSWPPWSTPEVFRQPSRGTSFRRDGSSLCFSRLSLLFASAHVAVGDVGQVLSRAPFP